MNELDIEALAAAVSRSTGEVREQYRNRLLKELFPKAECYVQKNGSGYDASVRDLARMKLIDRAEKAVDTYDSDKGRFMPWLYGTHWSQEWISFKRSMSAKKRTIGGNVPRSISYVDDIDRELLKKSTRKENVAAMLDVSAEVLCPPPSQSSVCCDDTKSVLMAWTLRPLTSRENMEYDPVQRRVLFLHLADGKALAIPALAIIEHYGQGVYARRRLWKNLDS